MGILVSQLHRNNEFLLWVKNEFDTPAEQTAAIKAFTWIKKQYPEAVPIIRGDLVYEETQEG
jgi:hypothetical protein